MDLRTPTSPFDEELIFGLRRSLHSPFDDILEYIANTVSLLEPNKSRLHNLVENYS